MSHSLADEREDLPTFVLLDSGTPAEHRASGHGTGVWKWSGATHHDQSALQFLFISNLLLTFAYLDSFVDMYL